MSTIDLGNLATTAVRLRTPIQDLLTELGRVVTTGSAILAVLYSGVVSVPVTATPTIPTTPVVTQPAPPVQPVTTPVASVTPPAPLVGLVKAINAERKKAGRPELTEDPAASKLAQGWAESMASVNLLTHGTFGDRISGAFPGRLAAEDIANGQTTAAEVVATWMGDEPHKANLLGPFATVGVGEAKSPTGVTYWCVDFLR